MDLGKWNANMYQMKLSNFSEYLYTRAAFQVILLSIFPPHILMSETWLYMAVWALISVLLACGC